jgi:hypothetical protein
LKDIKFSGVCIYVLWSSCVSGVSKYAISDGIKNIGKEEKQKNSNDLRESETPLF